MPAPFVGLTDSGSWHCTKVKSLSRSPSRYSVSMPASEKRSKTAFERSTSIARPIDDVWDLVTDWSRAAEWWPRVLEVTGPPTVEPGDTLTFSYQGKPASATIDVADRPRRLVLRRVNGPVSATFDYQLEPDSGSTTVELRVGLASEQALRVVAPLLRRALARTDRDQLDLLKRIAEGPTAPRC